MSELNQRTATHCPKCYYPVEVNTKGSLTHRNGTGTCSHCGKVSDIKDLVEAVQCASCNQWVSAGGIENDEMICPVCNTRLLVNGENTIVKADVDNLPFRCPTCYHPVTYREKGIFSKEKVAYCENKSCERYNKAIERHLLIRAVQCCSCYKWIDYARVHNGRVDCPHCKKTLSVEGETVKIYAEEVPVDINKVLDDDWVIYRSSERNFTYQSAVPMMPGFNAVLVEGTAARVIRPDSPKPFTERDKTQPIHADLYYVRTQFNRTFKYGTPEPVEVQDAYGNIIQIRAAAEVEHGVSDEIRFLSWSGHRELKSDDFEMDGRTLRSTTLNCFSRALYIAADQLLKSGETLTAMRLADLTRNAMSDMLSTETGLTCRSLRILNLNQEAAVDLLSSRVERSLQWITAGIQVHEKDQPELWATIRLSGSAQIRIKNRHSLMTTPQGVEWTRANTADSAAEHYLSDRIGEQVYAVFQEIIQGVIDDTGVTIDYLGHFFSHMQRVVGDFLNSEDSLLAKYGLSADNVTIQLKPSDIQSSAALIKRGQVEKQIATTEMDERLRKYTDGVEIAQKEGETEKHLRFKRLETDAKVADMRMDNEVDQASFEIEKSKNDLEIERIGMKEQTAKAQDEADHARKERQQEDELESLDHAYQVWLKKRRSDMAMTAAEQEDARGEAQLDIDLQRLSEEAQRQKELENEKLKAAVADVRRSIEASDLEQEQKKAAYDYLQYVTRLQDQQDLAERKAKFEADMKQLDAKTKSDDLRENIALVNQAADAKAKREESALQAAFARDLQLKQIALTHEAEILKLRMQALQRQDEANERAAQQANRLKEMDLQLKHLENMESYGVNKTEVQASVDKIKAICEAMTQESVARAAEAKENAVADKAERETAQNRAEALLKELMTLQKQRDDMQLQFRKEYDAGRLEVDKILAEHVHDYQVSDDLAELKKEMQKLAGSLDGFQKKNEAEKPNPPINIFAGGFGQPKDLCPKCGAKIGKYDTFCRSCGNRLV